ncbi:MAG: hypothetical protein RR580_03310, partial [Christensenellaceae bacterium]
MGQKLVWDDKRKKFVSVMELNERLSMEKEEKERKRLEQMSIDTVERNERHSGMGSPHEPSEVGRGGEEERPPKRRSFCPLGEN